MRAIALSTAATSRQRIAGARRSPWAIAESLRAREGVVRDWLLRHDVAATALWPSPDSLPAAQARPLQKLAASDSVGARHQRSQRIELLRRGCGVASGETR